MVSFLTLHGRLDLVPSGHWDVEHAGSIHDEMTQPRLGQDGLRHHPPSPFNPSRIIQVSYGGFFFRKRVSGSGFAEPSILLPPRGVARDILSSATFVLPGLRGTRL